MKLDKMRGGVSHSTASDTIILLYKISETLMEGTILPYIVDAVCSDLYYGKDDYFWFLGYDFESVHGQLDTVFNKTRNTSKAMCFIPGAVPKELDVQIHQYAAMILMAWRVACCGPGLFLFIICGGWSDTRGRRLLMVTPCVGPCLALGCYTISIDVTGVKVPMILAASAVQGIFSGAPIMFMAVTRHVTETTEPDKHLGCLGRVVACNFLGMFLGSLLSGVLQTLTTVKSTLTVTFGTYILCLLTVIICVEDKDQTRPKAKEKSEKKRTSKVRKITRLVGVEELKDLTMPLVKPREGKKRLVIIISLISLAFNQCLKVGDQDVTVLFVQQTPRSWPSTRFAYLLSCYYGAMWMAFLFLLPFLSDVLHMPDTDIVMLALVFKLVRTVSAGFCQETWTIFLSFVSGAVGALLNPGLRSVISRNADKDEVGKLFSIQASLETLTRMVGPSVFTGIYFGTVHELPAASYLAQAISYLGLVVLLLPVVYITRDPGAKVKVLTPPLRASQMKPTGIAKKVSDVVSMYTFMTIDLDRSGSVFHINDDQLS